MVESVDILGNAFTPAQPSEPWLPDGARRSIGTPGNASVSREVAGLLETYWALLDVPARLPLVTWLRRRDTLAGRIIRVPRVRYGTRYFLVEHMRRTLRALARGHGWRGLVDEDGSFGADAAALAAFERALPPVASRRLMAFVLGLIVFALSFSIANSVKFAIPTSKGLFGVTAEPLGKMTGAIVMLDRGRLMKATESFACSNVGEKTQNCSTTRGLETAPTSLILLAATIWLVLFLPLSALRLQRTLLRLPVPAAAEARAAFAADRAPAPGSAAEREARLLRRVPMGRPRELPFELFGQVTILLVPCILGVLIVALSSFLLLIMSDEDMLTGDGVPSVLLVTFSVGAFLILGAAARFVHVRRCSARIFDGDVVPSSAALRRRLGAQLIDTSVIAALVALAAPVWMTLSNHELRAACVLLGIVPFAALVHAAASAFFGTTLGGSLLGLHTRSFGGGRPGVRRLVVREVLFKWLPIGCAVFALVAGPTPFMPHYEAPIQELIGYSWFFWLGFGLAASPFVLDLVSPLFGHAKRTLHDIATDTIVVSARS